MLDFDSKCVGQGAKSEKTQETYIMKLIFLWKHKQALWGRKKMVHDNRLSSFCSSYVVLNIEEISIYCLLLSWWYTLSSPPPQSAVGIEISKNCLIGDGKMKLTFLMGYVLAGIYFLGWEGWYESFCCSDDFLLGVGGVEPPTKFLKKQGVGLAGSQVRECVAGNKGLTFCCCFQIKNKLKSEIFNDKKRL